jgi:hypothetical protein
MKSKKNLGLAAVASKSKMNGEAFDSVQKNSKYSPEK